MAPSPSAYRAAKPRGCASGRKQGLIRYIGITTSETRDFAAVETVLRREKPDFLQVNYSLADREAEKRLLPVAAEIGAAVLTDLPFGRGRVVFRAVRGRAVPDWAREFDAASWGQSFLKYLLGDERVTAVIPGTDKPQNMAEISAPDAVTSPMPRSAVE